MNDLLELTINAHGGMQQWKQLKRISCHIAFNGVLWIIKGKAGMLDSINVTADLHQQWVSHSPFGAPTYRTSYNPDRVAIETTEGNLVEELLHPRESFRGHTLETQWTDLQLAYFIGYGLWNYLTIPFNFALPGCELLELEPWQENGETLRRLQITFPDDMATHCKVQTFYIAQDGLIRRHDYDVDINGGTPGVHYFHDHIEVAGITLPTKHLIYIRKPDLTHDLEPLIVSIDVSDIQFS